jgi:hypothetical protein
MVFMAAPQAAPEEMSDESPEAEGPAEESGEGGMDIFREASQALGQAMEWLAAQPVPEEIKQAASKVLQDFGDIAEAVMSGAGGDQGAVPADQGAVPMQAGMSGVPMGPQTRG